MKTFTRKKKKKMPEIRIPCLGRGATFTTLTPQSLSALEQEVHARFQPLRAVPFSLYANGRKLLPEDVPDVDGFVDVILGLPGGKGGFGSMLRALGAQIEKTTNKDACRDLSGRRLRDINEEERLKDYVARQAEREQLAADKKEAKLDKLRRIARGENKHEFKDTKYCQEREGVTDRVHDAMDHAVKSAAAAKSAAATGVKRKAPEEAVPSTSAGPSRAKKGLWMGVELSESDLESSSDEDEEKEEEEKGKKN